METAWAAGARVGYLVAPNVLSYVNGGYTGTYWTGSTLLGSITGTPVGLHTDSFNTSGWFVGGGVENNLNFFGINAPGWFMKTEYRAAYLDREESSGTGRWQQPADRLRHHLQAFRANHQHVAGLPLQLDWRSDRREILISAISAAQKPRHRPGLFLCLEYESLRTVSRRATAAFSDR